MESLTYTLGAPTRIIKHNLNYIDKTYKRSEA